jgi:histidine triad (HIT) family protein|tara:strand:+ start:904 stop:1308 length:405 start_codon:yes stop_codon:yes gene_type:complete
LGSIFSKIIRGEIPCYKIAENEEFFAFLDISPLAKGHVLIVPKREVDKYFDLNSEEMYGINLFAKGIALAIENAIPCKRVGVAIVGLEVPHAHIHLIPLNSVEDINFERQKLKLSQEEFEEIAEAIRKQLKNLK